MIAKKGQIFTWDLIISLAIFLIILALILYLWNTSLWNVSYSEKMYELSWLATTVAEQLVRTTGYPINWHLDLGNVIVIGLTHSDSSNYSQDRILNADKFIQFVNLTYSNYSTTKNKLLATGEYDFYIEFACLDQAENCWSGLTLGTISDGVVNCSNSANFTIVNNVLNLQGEPRCIIGKYATPSSSVMMAVEKRTATFENKLNATITMTLVVWTGESAIISGITVMTTTTTAATTTTTTMPPGPFSCSIKSSCDSGEGCIFTMYDTYSDDTKGAHAATCDSLATYNNKVCCSANGCAPTCVIRSSPADCSPGYERVLSLYSDSNAHVQDPKSYSSYTTVVCCNTTSCGSSLTCNVKTSCDAGAGEVCLASMYLPDDSHLGSCSGAYSNKICCKAS